MTYRIGNQKFATLDDAKAIAESIFATTGVVAGIVESIDRESPLAQAYLFRRLGFNARLSLIMARQDIAAGTRRYAPNSGWRKGSGNWQSLDSMPRHASQSDRAYYCDDWPGGWRVTGRADEVSRANDSRAIDHSGWYTDDDGDSGTLAGYVLQLPARDGVAQYVAGTRHSQWDGVTLYPLACYDDAMECARSADSFAEHAAEHERDYNRAWQAGNRASELHDSAIADRRKILEICRDLRMARATISTLSMAARPVSRLPQAGEAVERLCAIARDKVAALLDSMREAREERDKLESDYGSESAFRENFASIPKR